jgi:nucleoside-diphosphate-sugar epimerase
MSILFVGDNIFLEQYISKHLSSNNYTNFISTRSGVCDFTDKNQVENLFATFEPSVIINYDGYMVGCDKRDLLKYNQSVLNIIDCAEKSGVGRIVHVANVGCYCHNADGGEFLKEDNLWVSNIYHNNCIYSSIQKSIYDLYQKYELDVAFLVMEDVYGCPYQSSGVESIKNNRVLDIYKIFKNALLNKEDYIKFFIDDPYQYMLHVHDAARAIYLAVVANTDKKPINIGSGFVYKKEHIIEGVQKIIGYKNKVLFDNTREIKYKPLLINRAASQLSWMPTTKLSEGLNQEVLWYNNSTNIDLDSL